jgi:MSHA biogenesis protein MshK
MDIAVKTVLLFALACSAAMAGPATAQSQGLTDPTRPPAALAAAGTGAASDGEPAAPAAPQLQSILVSREAGGRRVAVINGELVKPGMKVGDAVVERVGETEVVLRRGKARETLKLFPKHHAH